jgi:hypothetical protein
MNNDIKPNGGFPPIYECSKSELELVEGSKRREFAKPTSAVSIKDIMMRRGKNLSN